MKYTSYLLVLIALLLSNNLFAYDIEVKNDDGVTIYYNYINGGKELEVVHSSYRGCITIPEEVTFMNRTRKVTSIGYNAFSDCYNLTSVTIPKSVISIKNSAFSGCSNLTSIIIPDEVTSIGDNAFENCSRVNSVIIGNSVANIGSLAFSQCGSLTSISIPNNVKTIGASAFQNCSNLATIDIGGSVTSIGGSAFYYCNIDTVIIRNLASWCKIKFGFSYRKYQGNYIMDNSTANPLTHAPHIFSEDGTEIRELILPEGVDSISDGAFIGCKNIKKIIFPASLKFIGRYAFCNTGLKTLDLPPQLSTIGEFSFNWCDSLSEISLPNSIKEIGTGAFCSPISIIYSHIKDPFNCYGRGDTGVFTTNTIYNATLYVPKGTIEKYKVTYPWNQFIFLEERDYGELEVFKLTYIVDGEKYKSYEIEVGSVITPEPYPIKEGYTFSGWSEIPSTMPAHNVTVTGSFIKNYIGKCATPTISYSNGKLVFNCETSNAKCITTITDTDIDTHTGNELQLTATYIISAYATADGYEDSDVATATLCWIDADPQTEGIINNVAQIRAKAVMIQNNGNVLSVSGADEGAEINVYDTAGRKVGSGRATSNVTIISTTLYCGDVGIVKIGEKAIKIVIK